MGVTEDEVGSGGGCRVGPERKIRAFVAFDAVLQVLDRRFGLFRFA
jgi:hypothetical protein